MNQLICRLCLTVSENMAYQIGQETNTLDKLSCLNIQITINELLPGLVCCSCTKTLDDISTFRDSILQNQYQLIELHNKKMLHEFYQRLINKQDVKTEFEDEDFNQSFDYDSKPKDNVQCNQNNQEYETVSSSNENYVIVNCKEQLNNETKENKNLQKENKLVKNNIQASDPPNNYENEIRKRKGKLKIQTKKKHSQHTNAENEINNYAFELNTKTEKYIPEEKLDDIKHATCKETNPNSIKNEIALQTNYNKCLTCFKCLPSNSELIKHYKTIHNSRDKNNDTDLIQNKAKIVEDKEIGEEKPSRPYNCKVCGRTFAGVYDIIRHARAHSNHNLSCSRGCGYITAYKGALVDHEKRHEKVFRYKCATCGAGFHVKTWHDQHQNIHNNVKPFVCDICGMAFHMKRYLTSHCSSVHPKSTKGVKRLCPHCDLPFDNTQSFNTHLEEHMGKKKYLCEVCGKECYSSEQLKYHNNSHLGVKPFACSICNKRFAKRFNLSVHQRAHAGEKHLCQECGKYFAQRSTLHRHTRKCHPEIKGFTNKSEAS